MGVLEKLGKSLSGNHSQASKPPQRQNTFYAEEVSPEGRPLTPVAEEESPQNNKNEDATIELETAVSTDTQQWSQVTQSPAGSLSNSAVEGGAVGVLQDPSVLSAEVLEWRIAMAVRAAEGAAAQAVAAGRRAEEAAAEAVQSSTGNEVRASLESGPHAEGTPTHAELALTQWMSTPPPVSHPGSLTPAMVFRAQQAAVAAAEAARAAKTAAAAAESLIATGNILIQQRNQQQGAATGRHVSPLLDDALIYAWGADSEAQPSETSHVAVSPVGQQGDLWKAGSGISLDVSTRWDAADVTARDADVAVDNSDGDEEEAGDPDPEKPWEGCGTPTDSTGTSKESEGEGELESEKGANSESKDKVADSSKANQSARLEVSALEGDQPDLPASNSDSKAGNYLSEGRTEVAAACINDTSLMLRASEEAQSPTTDRGLKSLERNEDHGRQMGLEVDETMKVECPVLKRAGTPHRKLSCNPKMSAASLTFNAWQEGEGLGLQHSSEQKVMTSASECPKTLAPVDFQTAVLLSLAMGSQEEGSRSEEKEKEAGEGAKSPHAMWEENKVAVKRGSGSREGSESEGSVRSVSGGKSESGVKSRATSSCSSTTSSGYTVEEAPEVEEEAEKEQRRRERKEGSKRAPQLPTRGAKRAKGEMVKVASGISKKQSNGKTQGSGKLSLPGSASSSPKSKGGSPWGRSEGMSPKIPGLGINTALVNTRKDSKARKEKKAGAASPGPRRSGMAAPTSYGLGKWASAGDRELRVLVGSDGEDFEEAQDWGWEEEGREEGSGSDEWCSPHMSLRDLAEGQGNESQSSWHTAAGKLDRVSSRESLGGFWECSPGDLVIAEEEVSPHQGRTPGRRGWPFGAVSRMKTPTVKPKGPKIPPLAFEAFAAAAAGTAAGAAFGGGTPRMSGLGFRESSRRLHVSISKVLLSPAHQVTQKVPRSRTDPGVLPSMRRRPGRLVEVRSGLVTARTAGTTSLLKAASSGAMLTWSSESPSTVGLFKSSSTGAKVVNEKQQRQWLSPLIRGESLKEEARKAASRNLPTLPEDGPGSSMEMIPAGPQALVPAEAGTEEVPVESDSEPTAVQEVSHGFRRLTISHREAGMQQAKEAGVLAPASTSGYTVDEPQAPLSPVAEQSTSEEEEPSSPNTVLKGRKQHKGSFHGAEVLKNVKGDVGFEVSAHPAKKRWESPWKQKAREVTSRPAAIDKEGAKAADEGAKVREQSQKRGEIQGQGKADRWASPWKRQATRHVVSRGDKKEFGKNGQSKDMKSQAGRGRWESPWKQRTRLKPGKEDGQGQDKKEEQKTGPTEVQNSAPTLQGMERIASVEGGTRRRPNIPVTTVGLRWPPRGQASDV